MASRAFVLLVLITLSIFHSISVEGTSLPPPQCKPVPGTSSDRLQFIINYMVFQCEFFLKTSIGKGLNDVAPGLIQGVSNSTGARLANLEPQIRRMIEEFGYKTVSHIRAIVKNPLIKPIQAPRLNLTTENFDAFVRTALNSSKLPTRKPFDPYADTPSFLVAAFNFPLLTHQYLVAINPLIPEYPLRVLVAGVLGVQSAIYGAIQSQVSLRVNATVSGVGVSVLNATIALARFQNLFAMCGNKSEALIVPIELGADNRTTSNVIAADVNSLSFARFEREILRIVFGTANASKPGGYFPNGINGAFNRTIVTLKLN